MDLNKSPKLALNSQSSYLSLGGHGHTPAYLYGEALFEST